VTEENQIADDAAQTYVNRYYEAASDRLQSHIKLAFTQGYVKGMLRAGRIMRDTLKGAKA
jgi:hypothetical protein